MAENENTFVILQSLLTCVCERENHGSTMGDGGELLGEGVCKQMHCACVINPVNQRCLKGDNIWP